LDSIKNAIREIQNHKFVLVCDDQTREDEADLIMAAEFVETAHVNFMINHGRGLICAPICDSIAKRLELPLMVKEHTGSFETAFTVSVDFIHGTKTGISSKDRALTIKSLSNENSGPSDYAKPGHIFPLIAWEKGVLIRAGHTEAAVDLMKLAGLKPAAVLCETLSSEGVPLKGEALVAFSKEWNIPIISIKDLIAYRKSIA
jgi:3,4-dihydroxy 2-butanone 4-phosphate synthase / GTP cyclohydrolase II